MSRLLSCRLPLVLFALTAFVSPSYSQGIITTVAGTDWVFSGDGNPAVDAPLGQSFGLVADPAGNVYIADHDNSIVVKLQRDGILTVVAGNGIAGFSGDGGPARNASLNRPWDVALDTQGNLYISDNASFRIRKVTPDGIISTVAGNGRSGSTGDGGPATSAAVVPFGIFVAPDNTIYFAEFGSHKVRKISPGGIISTVAGNGQPGFSGDGGPAVSAGLNGPTGVTADDAGNLYIPERENNRIRKVSNGIISTFAGNGQRGFAGDGGPAVNASLSLFSASPVRYSSGTLYITDSGNNRIRTITPDGIIRTIVGNGQSAYAGDGGSALAASFYNPYSMALDAEGNIYIADTRNLRIRKVDRAGIVSTVAGNGAFRAFREGAPALNAFLFGPRGVAFDPAGNLYIADTQNGRVRRVTTNGSVITVAGGGSGGDGGPAVAAFLSTPAGVKIGPTGDVFLSDDTNNRIRKVAADGRISTVVGGGCTFSGFGGDGGPATSACVYGPRGLDIDAAGNIYFADWRNNRVRRVAANGTISTIAGNGQAGFGGDGGPAVNASLFQPISVALDAARNLFVSDSINRRIRMITPDGIITTVAGNGQSGFSGDGRQAISAAFRLPSGLCFDSAGNLFVADEADHRIRKVALSGVISTVAGNGNPGFSGDGGPSTTASLNAPAGCAVDPVGNLYIADQSNDRIRMVSSATISFGASPAALAFQGRSNGPVAPAQQIRLTSSVNGLPFTADVTTAGGGNWLHANPSAGVIPGTLDITADPTGLDPGLYRGTVTITASNASPPIRAVSVTFTVEPGDPPKLAVQLKGLAFSFTRSSGPSQAQLTVSNVGGGSLEFAASTSTTAGGAWLSVAPAGGTVTPTSAATLTVTANPARLAPGTFTGRVSITGVNSGDQVDLPVTMTISAIQQSIVLSQTGLTFTAVAGGGAAPSQTFGVLNAGQGVMNWSATASTLSGGSNWLSITPENGSTDAGSLNVPLVEVKVDARALAAGDYYGQVEVRAPGAADSPQYVSVVLNVLPAGSNPGPVVRPTGLIFTGLTGDSSPGSQTVLVSNITATPTSFTSGRLTSDGQSWFVHVPASATVTPNQAARIVVQPNVSGLTPGIRRGVLTLLFQDGATRTVNILLVLIATPGGGSKSLRVEQAGCSPTRLLPVFTLLPENFSVASAWPNPVEVKVVDDCGSSMISGAVTAAFSNGDPPLNLVSLRDGRWSGTWQARNTAASQVTVSAAAEVPELGIRGTVQVTGGLRSNQDPPVVGAGAVVSAASFSPQAPLAPGSIISIFGTRLAEGQGSSPRLPLDTQLAGTTAIIGGRSMPLLFASQGQVNALVPYDIAANTRQQIVLRRGDSYTLPEAVLVAPAQPAVFTKGQTGQGQGVVVDLQNRYAEPGNAAKVGDAVVIYCAGLGAVDPPVVAGAAAPSSPLSATVNPVTVSIGGVAARVLFSGLAPGFAGLYQVNATVPQGVTPGDRVPVTLTVAGQSSSPVTIAIH